MEIVYMCVIPLSFRRCDTLCETKKSKETMVKTSKNTSVPVWPFKLEPRCHHNWKVVSFALEQVAIPIAWKQKIKPTVLISFRRKHSIFIIIICCCTKL